MIYFYSNVRSISTMVQHIFILKSSQAYRYIDVKKYYNKIDTIDLGIIYFENLKSVKKRFYSGMMRKI